MVGPAVLEALSACRADGRALGAYASAKCGWDDDVAPPVGRPRRRQLQGDDRPPTMDRARAPLTGADKTTEANITPETSMASTDASQKSTSSWARCLRCLRGSVPYVRDSCLVLCAAAVVLVTRRRGPAAPGFFCHDSSITYPFHGDTVSVTALALLTILLPPAVIVAVELAQQRRGWSWSFTRPLWTAAVLTARHISCQAFLFAAVEVVKCLVSRPRPSFLDLCQPVGYNQTLCDDNFFISEFRCASMATAKSHTAELLIQDSMLSFPSGHSAISCCTATFLALYLASRSRGRRRAVLRVGLIFCCVMYGCVISFSRITDHRHHLPDVLVGMLLGTLAGLLLCFGACEEKLFAKPSQRHPLVTQSSVISNRTSDTQTTSLDEVL
ncbi:phospholipid phosphatase 1-like [Pollicipes pollicipes]|uniref:phospholipid phosphatase 1-like n=1 Tax=Pollicipes pollicipes TaxID=41117 RepID=UPI0018858530|nr:phospholipid phosphatase 1-like [Pollicipes pollicipes]